MTNPIAYHHVYADSAGESHIDEAKVELAFKVFAPPAQSLEVSAIAAAAAFGLLRLPVGWYGDWRPSPSRQWLFFLAGHAAIEASDGRLLRAGPGSIVLLEDTTGRGHLTRVVGDAPVVIAAVQVPSDGN